MPNHDFTLHRRHAAARGLAHHDLDKRQRVALTPAVDDEETTSTAVGRETNPKVTTVTATRTPARVPLTTTEETSTEEETSTTSRTTARTTSVTSRAALTTSSSTTSRTPLTTTSEKETSTTPTSTRTTSSTPTSTSSTARTSSSSSSAVTSASVSGISDASNSTTDSSGGSSSNTAAVAGGVIAAIIVLAIAGFFLYRWRKNKKNEVDESAAIFPYGGGPNNGAAGAKLDERYSNKRQSGYHQQVDSYDDLPGAGAGAAAAAAAGIAAYGEKDNGHGYSEYGNHGDNEKYPDAAPYGMAGYGSMAHGNPMNYPSADNSNFAGRGSFNNSSAHLLGRDMSGNLSPLQPGSFVTSPGFSSDTQERFSNIPSSAGPFGAPGPGYPPLPSTPPQNSYANYARGSPNGGPQAAMMGHNGLMPSGNSDHLPPHQDHALSAAYAAANPEAGLGAPDISRRMSSRTSMPVIAGLAPLPGAPSPNLEDRQESSGPFEDPQYEGKLYAVTRIFEPSMPDELVILPGDTIQIVMAYDDGWCLGVNLSSTKRNGGGEPAKGVFPRDCVEEMPAGRAVSPAASAPAPQQQPRNVHETIQEEDEDANEDTAIVSQAATLQRAPTLPMLDMGEQTRFSMGGASTKTAQRQSVAGSALRSSTNGNNRQSLSVPANTALPPSEFGGSDSEDTVEDAYGGFASSPSPLNPNFPPNVQIVDPAGAVPSSLSPGTGQFGSSQHIADYASHLEGNDPHARSMTGNTDASRLSAVSDGNGRLIDEFPSTPRTAASPNMPSSAGLHYTGAATPSQRLSVAGSPAAGSVRNVKRTSSLIASKDAEVFLSLGQSSNRNSTASVPAQQQPQQQ